MTEIKEAKLHENGTIKFDYFGESNGNPYMGCICTNAEGHTCEKRFYLTPNALPYTIEDLRLFSIEGESDEEVVRNAATSLDAACDFETEEKEKKDGVYYTVSRVRNVGGEWRVGGGGPKKIDLATALGKMSASANDENVEPLPF